MKELAGKHALVCGSTQGIGLASAMLMASRGAKITLIARNEGKLKEALGQLDDSEGQEHDYLVADFSARFFAGDVKRICFRRCAT